MKTISKKRERKEELITIRCTKKDKEKLEKQANKKNKSLRKYILDCSIAGLERRKDRERKRVVLMIENALRYVLRIRKNEDRASELLAYGGMGVSLYTFPEQIIQEFLYIQKLFRIDARGGRRMYHEVLRITELDFEN